MNTGRPGPVPLRAADALFLHAQTPLLCQQVGAVVLLEAAGPGAPVVGAAEFRAAVGQRLPDVPELCRRLERPRSRWRQPCWIADGDIDASERVREVTVGSEGMPDAFSGVVDAFFSDPCDPYRKPWEFLLVRGALDGQRAVLVKVHHTLGDSQAIIPALTKFFDDASAPRPPPAAPRTVPAQGGRFSLARVRVAAGTRALRGLCHLALAGTAPATSLCGAFTSSRRQYVPLSLPAADFARTARALNVGITDLLVATMAEALSKLLRARGEQTSDRVLRVAMPRARPTTPLHPAAPPGNRSAAITPDVPVGPLQPLERLAAVRDQIALRLRRGEPDGAALVLRAMNLLPPPVQRRAAAAVYQHRWFNLLISVFPGDRRQHRLLGARVEGVHPVLPLADGVGLAIGAMTWERSLSVGILADVDLVPDVDKLAVEVVDAFREYQAAPFA
jgi:diacylglycerol O-acyltransferase / wax synthase